jgi:hypothetical protein
MSTLESATEPVVGRDARSYLEPLYQVWFDVNCGQEATADWWWDTEPEPCSAAYIHAADLKSSGWICVVLPEGKNPRPDGRWDNPC